MKSLLREINVSDLPTLMVENQKLGADLLYHTVPGFKSIEVTASGRNNSNILGKHCNHTRLAFQSAQ